MGGQRTAHPILGPTNEERKEMSLRDKYADRRETSYDERIAELAEVHGAADCAEYADREDFIEQVIPKLDTYSVRHLWVLSALLRDRADGWLGKFVAFYARKVEAAVARAIADHEITEHPPHDPKAKRWYMPSPTLLWGEWRATEGHREGWAKGWKDRAATAPAKPTAKAPIDLSAFLHNWTPKSPS
jgi:hypothetical protein